MLACQVVVEHDEVRLYMDCGEAERTTFHRKPEKLTFTHHSGIFVANAGSTGLEKFVVSENISDNGELGVFFLWKKQTKCEMSELALAEL